jgi:hypothetical protein
MFFQVVQDDREQGEEDHPDCEDFEEGLHGSPAFFEVWIVCAKFAVNFVQPVADLF